MKVYSARDALAKALSPRLGSGWDMVWIEGGKGDNCQRIWDENMLGEIRELVRALPAPLSAWAWWTYADCQEERKRARWGRLIMAEVVNRYDAAPAMPFNKLGSMLPAADLVLCAMEDGRHRERCGLNLYSYAELARLSGLGESDLYNGRRWRLFFNAIVSVVEGVVADTLQPVGALVGEINQRRGEAA